MLKIIISAYACNPYLGSEAGVGWGFVSGLSKFHELHVIVEKEKHFASINKYISLNPDLNIKFYFIKKIRFKLLRKIWPPSYYWFYRLWNFQAYILAKQLNEKHDFDIAHQLTMVGFREPGYLWRLDIPFVWGPIGGFGYFPIRLFAFINLKSILYYIIYNIINFVQANQKGRSFKAAIKANQHNIVGLICATKENQFFTDKYWNVKSQLISEVGYINNYNNNIFEVNERERSETFKIIWVGLLIPRKALNILLYALAKIDLGASWSLDIVGDGECMKSLIRLSMNLGISENIFFHGDIPRADVLKLISGSHVMAITSLRDLSSTITIESLSMGTPIICPDHCGFAEIVDSTCGIKYVTSSPVAMINELSKSLSLLVSDEDYRRNLCRGAYIRAQYYTWENKIKLVNSIYRSKKTFKRY